LSILQHLGRQEFTVSMKTKLSLFVFFVSSLGIFNTFATGGGGMYIGDFVSGQAASAQAQDDWDSFRSSLEPNSYDTVTISGTFDTAGRTLHDAVNVPKIAQALKDGAEFSFNDGTYTWRVGGCGGDIEFAAGNTTICDCGNSNYSVRPKIISANWGGVNTDTCFSDGNELSQRMIVVFTGPTIFRIQSLTANNISAIEAANIIVDDRGGIAVSSTKAFLTGDGATGIYNASDLFGGVVGALRDGLVADLHSGTIYTLAFNGIPVPTDPAPGSFTINQLIQLDPQTGALTGTVINLSTPITLRGDFDGIAADAAGVFSGYDRIVLVNATSSGPGGVVYNIELPSGVVSNLGTLTDVSYTTRSAPENWASWGVAEFFNDGLSVVYVDGSTSPRTKIVRTNINTNITTTVVDFAPNNLSDSHEFTVVPKLGRWYFHYEAGDVNSIAGDGPSETFAFADATFLIRGRALYAADGAGGNANCHLFILDPANGSVIRDVGSIGFAVTGMAFDPSTGILYGATGHQSPVSPDSIITIDPNSGAGTLIGPEVSDAQLADITFAAGGLFGWGESSDDLYSVDPATAQTTKVGESGLSTRGSGISANSADVLYYAGDDSNGLLRTIDRTTGTQSGSVDMSNAPFDNPVPALAFNPEDLLFGAVGPVRGGPDMNLTTINTSTGVVTDVGPTINFLDALAFGPAPTCDSNPPVINVPNNITVDAGKKRKNGRRGRVVNFHVSAVDPEDGAVAAVANPPSGSFFRVGTTTVTVTATDSCGNISTKKFKVTVKKKG
jgi:hypothetical protein